MNLLGNSTQIKEIRELIRQVAPTDITVLITGESGTGKEIVANLLHEQSARKAYPFIVVNCGAIPEGIIESELFGHQKGAFTGAIENRQGYFEMADKGTIFLDEIGDMPLLTQVKLLRVLETGEFIKVGGNKYIKVDVRVIAATNKNLKREVENKNFREDLYFRLKLVNIRIPPLRERKSDIIVLFHYYINLFCEKNNIQFKGISEDALEFIQNYSWSGNARELRNFCESLVVLFPDKFITLEDVKKNLHLDSSVSLNNLPAIPFIKTEYSDKDILFRAMAELKSDILELKNILFTLLRRSSTETNYNDDDFVLHRNDVLTMDNEEIEIELLKYLLKIHKWDVKKVSQNLGQSDRNIYRKIKKYNIDKDI